MSIVRLATLSTGNVNNEAQPTAAVASSESSPAARKGEAPTDSQVQTVATQPTMRYMLFGVMALAVGYFGGIGLQHHFHPELTKMPVLPAGLGILSLLYVMAQAIERVLVPVSWFGGGFLRGNGSGSKPTLAKNHQSALVKALQEPGDDAKAQAAANAKYDLEQYKANLTATTFGIAALLAMLVSGYTGLFLLTALGLHVAGWLDLLVTGLAIAGGTKPLHDAISSISSASQVKKAVASS